MRIALVSDSHTKHNTDRVLSYLQSKNDKWKLDLIIINGDILGENEVRESYGFNYNKVLFHASIDRKRILNEISEDAESLLSFGARAEQGALQGDDELKFSGAIRSYVMARYAYLGSVLERFSRIAKTLFNVGTYESPLHYLVIRELAFLLGLEESTVRRIAMLTDYRDSFKNFLADIHKNKALQYIGGHYYRSGDLLIAGIPGLNPSSIPVDSSSEFQEKITSDLMGTLMRQVSYTNKLLLLNQVQGKLRKEPFSFRPGSLAVRQFIEDTKGKMRQKIFVQSYHHWPTTHFYEASEFHFILNNAAVNNSLFNILDIGAKVVCHDIDPSTDRSRKLKLYNFNLADYSTPKERLSLNYDDPDEILKERKLEGCTYI